MHCGTQLGVKTFVFSVEGLGEGVKYAYILPVRALLQGGLWAVALAASVEFSAEDTDKACDCDDCRCCCDGCV